MKSEYKRVVMQASDEALAGWIIKNMLGQSDEHHQANAGFLAVMLKEVRRQCTRPEALPPGLVDRLIAIVEDMEGLGATQVELLRERFTNALLPQQYERSATCQQDPETDSLDAAQQRTPEEK